MTFFKTFAKTAIATTLVVLPAASWAAWKRTYSYGSQFSILGYEVTFIDDSVMPLKALTAVTVYVKRLGCARLHVTDLRTGAVSTASGAVKAPAWIGLAR